MSVLKVLDNFRPHLLDEKSSMLFPTFMVTHRPDPSFDVDVADLETDSVSEATIFCSHSVYIHHSNC
ncbi:hypothetical protein Hanom_Chr07g00626091 [Helianthus anomalus]